MQVFRERTIGFNCEKRKARQRIQERKAKEKIIVDRITFEYDNTYFYNERYDITKLTKYIKLLRNIINYYILNYIKATMKKKMKSYSSGIPKEIRKN